MFTYSFEIHGHEGKTTVDAIPCKSALHKYISDETHKQEILDLYGKNIGRFVCPDIPSFEIWDKTFFLFTSGMNQSQQLLIRI